MKNEIEVILLIAGKERYEYKPVTQHIDGQDSGQIKNLLKFLQHTHRDRPNEWKVQYN